MGIPRRRYGRYGGCLDSGIPWVWVCEFSWSVGGRLDSEVGVGARQWGAGGRLDSEVGVGARQWGAGGCLDSGSL